MCNKLIVIYIFLSAAAIFLMANSFLKINDTKTILEGDLVQDYVMAMAYNDNLNPYQPVNALIKIYFPGEGYCTKLGTSPHTPITVLLFSYLTFLDIKTLRVVWFFLSYIALFLSIKLFTKNKKIILISFLFSVLSLPFIKDIFYGQFNSFILLNCCLSYFLYNKGYKFLSGILIGLSINIKIYGWIFMAFYLVRREWKALSGVLASLSTGLILVMSNFESQIISEYFRVSSAAFNEWINSPAVISLISVTYKLIHPFMVIDNPESCSPLKNLFSYSDLTHICSFLFCFFILSGSFLFILKQNKSNSHIFASLLTLSAVANPISWMHYGVCLIPKLVITIEEVKADPKNLQTKLKLILFLIFLYVDFSYASLISDPANGSVFIISNLSLLSGIIPTILVLIIALL